MSSAFFFLRINDHVQYLRRIQQTLAGEGDFHGVAHNACKLGVWLFGEGRAEVEGIGPEAVKLLDDLVEPHRAFHEASARAIELKEEGNDAASKTEVTEMMKLSVVLINKLMDMDKLSMQRG